MRTKIFLFLPMLFLVLVSACGSDDPQTEDPKTIVDLASETADLSTLVAALQEAGLVSALEADGPFTVFAPNNAAFQALLDSDPTWNTLADIPDAVLTSVLLFHVVEGKVMAADLSDTYVNTLSTGPNSEPLSLQIEVSPTVRFNGTASPLSTDIEASNGVVHIVDEVMLPPSIVNFALNNSEFSSLVAALTDSRHTTNYVTTLASAGPFTVFAPNNAAFQALLDTDATWNTIGDIPIATLEAVLNYHVVNGANVQADQLTDGQVITMFGSGDITVDLSSGAALSTTSGQTVDIIATDVQGTNGVVHVVESVLLP